jgi:hypothetical protein
MVAFVTKEWDSAMAQLEVLGSYVKFDKAVRVVFLDLCRCYKNLFIRFVEVTQAFKPGDRG